MPSVWTNGSQAAESLRKSAMVHSLTVLLIRGAGNRGHYSRAKSSRVRQLCSKPRGDDFAHQVPRSFAIGLAPRAIGRPNGAHLVVSKSVDHLYALAAAGARRGWCKLH
jgi:hypothetical protein